MSKKMALEVFNETIPCKYWEPEDGVVFQGGYALDTETCRIDEKRPWLTPPFVVAAVYDGQRAFFLTRKTLAEFFRANWHLSIIMHNAAFDLKVMDMVLRGSSLNIYDLVDHNRVYDTWILSRLWRLATTGNPSAEGSGLDAAAQSLLGLTMQKNVTDRKGINIRTNFGQYIRNPEAIPDDHLTYLLGDVVATFRLYPVLERKIQQLRRNMSQTFGFVNFTFLDDQWNRHGLLTHHIQLRAAIALDRVTRNGLHVKTQGIENMRIAVETALREVKKSLLAFGYRPGENGCDLFMQKMLTRIEKREGITFDRTETGKISTSATCLEAWRHGDPFIGEYLEYKRLRQLSSTFLSKLVINHIHPGFDCLKTTGRTSSFGAINAQNLPRLEGIRECFIPSPGHVFIDADYAAVELATLAQATLTQFRQRSLMAEAIKQGADLHQLVAARMAGKAEGEVTKEEWQKAKAINFGKPGGMGDASLARYAQISYGVEMTEAEAKCFSEAWLNLFPEMRFFLNESSNLGEQIARLLGIHVQDYLTQTGRGGFDGFTSDMLGWMCRKALSETEPTTGHGRPYTEKELDYFWERAKTMTSRLPRKWQTAIDERLASPALAMEVSNHASRDSVLTLTGRLRANASYTARHNTIFQGLAADGAKLALWKLFRAGYRVVNFIHDEFLVEVPENENLTFHAEEIQRLMIEGMQEVVSDVLIGVEYAASRAWSKNAKAVCDDKGNLVTWKPPQEPAADEVLSLHVKQTVFCDAIPVG